MDYQSIFVFESRKHNSTPVEASNKMGFHQNINGSYHKVSLMFQGVLMFKDQYRAIMQYSLPRDAVKSSDTGSLRLIHDWICGKVRTLIDTLKRY